MDGNDAQLDFVRSVIRDCGERIATEGRLPSGLGYQLRTQSKAIVNVFDNGTIQLQGRPNPSLKARLEDSSGSASLSRKVFVVYGHNRAARDELERLLRRWNLDPILLDDLPSQGQTIIEKLEYYRTGVDFAVVLATPDDEGHAAGRDDEKAFRARQNVVLELGMMLAVLGRERVAILMKGQMERPSDIQGLIYIPFKDRVADADKLLAKEIDAAGIAINLNRL